MGGHSSPINHGKLCRALQPFCRLFYIQNMASQMLFPYTTGRALPWRQNEHNHILNHRRLECLLNCLLRGTPKKTSKLRVNGMCEKNPPVTSGLTSQRANNAVNVSIWWRHHGIWPWIKLKSNELDRFSCVRQILLHVMHLRIFQQSIVTSPAERKLKAWDTGSVSEVCRIRNKIMYVLSWLTVYALTQYLFLVFIKHRKVNNK